MSPVLPPTVAAAALADEEAAVAESTRCRRCVTTGPSTTRIFVRWSRASTQDVVAVHVASIEEVEGASTPAAVRATANSRQMPEQASVRR